METKNWLWPMAIGFLILTGCGGGDSASPPSAQAQTLTTTTTDVVTGVLIQTFTASDVDGVQSVSCPSTMLAVSVGCTCHIPNSGDIFGMSLAGNGAACGCDVGSGPTEPIDVYVTCASTIGGKAISSVTLTGIVSQDDLTAKWADEIRQKENELQEMRQLHTIH